MFFGKKKSLSALSDEVLIERYRPSGDVVLVGELFQRYAHLVSALALKYLQDPNEVEDAVMDVFELLVRDLRTHEVQNFKAWLYSVTKNLCLKKLRKRKQMRQKEVRDVNFDLELMEFPVDTDLEVEIRKNQRLEQLQEALGQLPDQQKICVELFYLQDKSYKEVAEITGFSLKQVKSFIQNGKRRLKGLLS
ncbi:MAG: RNA polymerase sigma factor [Salibacteraceae bacterium]